MINLLPPKKRSELRATIHNSILIRYAIASLAFFAVTIVIHLASILLLSQAETANTTQNQDNMTKASEYDEVAALANEYKQNLAAAKTLFDGNIPYTEALSNLAKTLPAGVIIDSVSLEPSAIGKPTTITAHAVSYEAATNLSDAFSNSTIATNVSIASVTDTSIASSTSGSEGNSQSSTDTQATASSAYPIQVILNITFTEDLLYPPGSTPSKTSTETGDTQPDISDTQTAPQSNDSQPTSTNTANEEASTTTQNTLNSGSEE